ncbi:hypothetical protein Vi05172_g490 [Venturia inaequalis]|nr:hypothetical protein Vi05172_g490 [Venturia inaequalis]
MSLQLPTPIPAHISVLSHKTKSVHFGKQNPLIHRILSLLRRKRSMQSGGEREEGWKCEERARDDLGL